MLLNLDLYFEVLQLSRLELLFNILQSLIVVHCIIVTKTRIVVQSFIALMLIPLVIGKFCSL